MISLSTIDANLNGNVIINEDTSSKINTNTSRVTLVQTLDGGAVAVHSGTTDLDRNIQIKGQINSDQESILWDFLDNESYVLMAYKTDLFLVSLKALATDNGKLKLSVYIINNELKGD